MEQIRLQLEVNLDFDCVLTLIYYWFGQSLASNLVVDYTTTLTKQINIVIYFENLTVKLHILYVFKTHVKFHANLILFTIRSIKLFMDQIVNNIKLAWNLTCVLKT